MEAPVASALKHPVVQVPQPRCTMAERNIYHAALLGRTLRGAQSNLDCLALQVRILGPMRGAEQRGGDSRVAVAPRRPGGAPWFSRRVVVGEVGLWQLFGRLLSSKPGKRGCEQRG